MKRFYTAFLFFSFSTLAICDIITIKADGSGDYTEIQIGIDNAQNGDEIVLEPGIYTAWGNAGLELRGKRITLRSTDPNNTSVVQSTILDCLGSETTPRRAFWIHEGDTIDTIVRGLKVVNGYGPDISSTSSGGVAYIRSQVTFRQCIFENNQAGRGGVAFSEYEGGAIFEDCRFINNRAENGGALNMPGLLTQAINCVFEYNSAEDEGGAIRHAWSDALLLCQNCLFSHNTALDGGAVYMHQCNGSLISNEFRFNQALDRGGAVFADTLKTNSTFTVQNNLFTNNKSLNTGAVYLSMSETNIVNVINNTFTQNEPGGLVCWNAVSPSIINNIFAFNIGNGVYTQGTSVMLDYNCMFENEQIGNPGFYSNYGGTAAAGTHDFEADPLFANSACADPNENNYHILSPGGYWEPYGPYGEGGWRDDFVTQTSPCLDMGDPSSDISAEAQYNGRRINIGAYGGTWQASRTPLLGDVTKDGKVDFQDLLILSENWLVGTS